MVNVKVLLLLIITNASAFVSNARVIDSLFAQSDALLKAGELEKANAVAYNALQLAEDSGNRSDLAWASFRLANVLQEMRIYDGAFSLYETAIKWAGVLRNDSLLARTYLYFGGMKIRMTRYSEGELNIHRSIEIATDLKDAHTLASCNLHLGISKFEQKLFDEAIEYYKKSLEEAIRMNNETLISVCYHNMGITYRELNEIDKALEYSKKALAIRIKRNEGRIINDYFRDLLYLEVDTFSIEDALAMNAVFFKTLDLKEIPLYPDILEPQAYIQEQILIGVIKNRHELETTRKRKQLFSFLAYGFGLLLVTFGILFLYWKRKVRKHIKQIEARGTYVTGTLGERIQPLIQTNNSLYVECYTLLAAGLNITQVATYLKRDRKTIYAYINDIGEILRVEDVKADALKYGKRVSNDPETASVPDSKTGD